MSGHFPSILPRPGSALARAGALGVVVLVAVLSLMPNLAVPDAAPGRLDLVIHLVMQGTLGFALVRGWPGSPGRIACALVILVVGLELGQLWVPGREFSTADLLSNALGAGLGGLAAWWTIRA